ncbi:MAG: AmmeMemoRadiSam system radical SAM enzyme [Candidatus Eisenbacteria bacterium]
MAEMRATPEPPEARSAARWWRALEDGRLLCLLCPHACRIGEGETGRCCVRKNSAGRLRSLSYGQPTGFAVDPIEKKPLFHFLPGSEVLSFGTYGCTLSCRFCQNWPHSHPAEIPVRVRPVSPAEIVALAERHGTPSIAYTYNEPTVFAEYMVETARLAREQGLRNVAVTNGYIAAGARNEVFADLDAANVDLKGFSDEFYRDQAGGRLRPVLDTIEWMHRETQIWLEITTLLIPGLNDSDEQLHAECDWIAERLGADVPVHFTAFHPDFQMRDRPRTPAETLRRACGIARARGLRYGYVGNIMDEDGASTRCPQCGMTVIARGWHAGDPAGLEGSRCRACGGAIAGVFFPRTTGH